MFVVYCKLRHEIAHKKNEENCEAEIRTRESPNFKGIH
jgi:hypothetical protein